MQAVESGLTLNPLIKVLSLHQRALRHAVSSAERAALGYSEETELRWLEDAFVEVIDEEEREIHVKKDMKMRGHISHQTSFLLLVKTENSHPVNGLLISLHLCVCARARVQSDECGSVVVKHTRSGYLQAYPCMCELF